MHQVEKYAQPPRHGEFTHSPNLHNSCLPPTSPIRSISPSVPDRPTTRFRFHPSKKPQRNRPTEPKLFLLSRLLTSAEPENLLNAWSVMHMIVASLVGRAENHSDFSNTTRWSFPCLSQNTCASLRDLPNNFELLLATRGKTCSRNRSCAPDFYSALLCWSSLLHHTASAHMTGLLFIYFQVNRTVSPAEYPLPPTTTLLLRVHVTALFASALAASITSVGI